MSPKVTFVKPENDPEKRIELALKLAEKIRGRPATEAEKQELIEQVNRDRPVND